MNTTGLDGTYIDYFNTVHGFGIRVLEDRCFVVIQIEDGQLLGRAHPIPVQLETAPSHVRMIVDDHLTNFPTSDLMDVLTGKKSFQEALDLAAEIKAKPTKANRAELPKHAS